MKLPLELLFLLFFSAHPTEATYRNTSSTIALPTITPAPIYCGTCAFYFEVHAHVWWSSVLTDYIATWIYTVDKGSGSTIGSSLKVPMNATIMPGKQNVTAYAGGGPVEYTTLNSLPNGALATIVQTNLITLNGTKNGYGVSTIHVNTSLTGTARTTCEYSYYGPNPTNTSILPGLPAQTGYSYTTVIPYDDTYNMTNANAFGLDILASDVATYLHLSVPNCTYYGGGTGTLKVAVTALTSVSIVYAPAQAQVSTTISPAVPDQTTALVPTISAIASPQTVTVIPIVETTTAKTQIAESSTLPNIDDTSTEDKETQSSTPNSSPPYTPSISSESGVYITKIIYTKSTAEGFETHTTESTISLGSESTQKGSQSGISTSAAEGSESYTTTIVYTSSGSTGVQTITTVATLPSGSYSKTVVETISGLSGVETTSETIAVNLASIILSLAGITPAATTSTSSGLTPSASAPAEFTGSACRTETMRLLWLSLPTIASLALLM